MNSRPSWLLFIGVCIGFVLAYTLLIFGEYSVKSNGHIIKHDQKEIQLDPKQKSEPCDQVRRKVGNSSYVEEDRRVGESLVRHVRILCWVMTQPENHEKRAVHIKNTWGKRCNVLLFMSTGKDDSLPTIQLHGSEGRDHLWYKTKEAFQYVYDHYLDDADWFLRADDDTYLIVENLRFLLAAHSPTDPVYFGCRFKPFLEDGYMSGGAGMVLSKEALIRFVKGLPDPKLCQQDETSLGKCLQSVGVHPRDSRDSLGRGRFFPFTPDLHIIPGLVDGTTWYRNYVYYETHEGLQFTSEYTISFHYVPSHLMHTFDFFIYHFKLFGYNRNVVF